MRIWTHQPIKVIEDLLEGKPYICDPSKSDMLNNPDSKNFKFAYDWISEKLSRISNKPEDVIYPVWGYTRYDNQPKRPNCTRQEFHLDNKLSVMLELDIPDNEILLTDYDSWHTVLSHDYVDSINDNLTNEEKEEAIVKSWDGIILPNNYGEFYIQGVFWKINPEDVIDYVLLKPKRRKINSY